MRQLLITDRFLPHKGGSRVYYYEICRRLLIPVITSPENGASEFDQKQAFPIYRYKGIRPEYQGKFKFKQALLNILFNYIPPVLTLFYWSIWHLIRKKTELIHAGGFQISGTVAFLIKKLFRCPYLVYAHGEEVLATKDSRVMKFVMKAVFESANKIIVNSEYTKNLILKLGVSGVRISIVNPGISESFFQQPENIQKYKDKYNLSGKKVLLTVGRLTPRKGHIKVLEALPKLISSHPNLHYLIVGTGQEQKNLESYIKNKGLEKHVQLTGGVDEAELKALYQLCEIFILPNRRLTDDIEGFGMVFLEAGAAKKAVIGGRSGGAVEAIQDRLTGYLINPENTSEIVEKLNKLLNTPGLSQMMGLQGKRWAEFFLWSKQIQKIKTIAEKALLD